MARARKQAAPAALNERTNGAAPAAFAGYEHLADLGRENFAAMLRANAALSEGFEAIGKEVIGYARTSFESAAEAAAALLGAKTLDDVVQLNTAFARLNLDQLMAHSAKLSEMGAKVANEALAPLGGRVEATLETLAKPLSV